MHMRHLIDRPVGILLLASALLGACTETPLPPDRNDTTAVPQQYVFDSRFKQGTSSVSYEGQTVRNLLIQDLSAAMAALAKPGATPITEADLLRLYEHADASNLSSTTTITGGTPLEARYSAIATSKKLSDKISPAVVVGFNATSDALVREWIRVIATNSQDPGKLGTPAVLLDANGIEIPEIVNKLLLGAVSYYQATSVYMNGLLSKDNAAAADDGKGGTQPYTVMEHNWDEAFGYFGAARDYARYTDAQLAGTSSDYTFDSNGDGKIDFRSEYNFAFARNAGKRDKSAGTDFSKEAFDAFLKARTAIVNKASVSEIIAHRAAASLAWEKIIASTVAHYINDVATTMAALDGTRSKEALLRHQWSELKGFLASLQFNTMKRISDAQIQQLHALIGDRPVVAAPSTSAHTEYLAKLDDARNVLKSAYGFSDAHMDSW